MTLIGLSGFIGSGKDTVAAYLKEKHSFVVISYASTLKDVVSILFGWDRHKLEGTTAEDRLWREQIDVWWEKKLGIPGLTPRMMLQKIGTDLFRTYFHPDIWITIVERKIIDALRLNNRVVVTDCRFVNEGELIHRLGGNVVRVCRGDTQTIEDCKIQGMHPSEYNILTFPFDYHIDNNGTLEDLYRNVQERLLR